MFEISREPSGRFPVTAVIVVPPLISVPEFVMKALVPLISHFPSRSTALVWTFPASLPALGSVSPKPHNIFPLCERYQILLLLSFGPEKKERRGTQGDVSRHRYGRRSIGARDFHHRQRVAHRVGSGSPILLGKRQPHEAELGHLRNQLVRETLVAIHLFGARPYLVTRELARQALDRLLLVG